MLQDPDALVLLGGYRYTYSEEESAKKKLQTPVKVTTPLRGPLKLANGSSLAINFVNDRHCTCQPPPPAVHLPSIRLSRWDGLKHHVLDIRRPLEDIEDQLSGLTRADIHNSMTEWRGGNVSSDLDRSQSMQ